VIATAGPDCRSAPIEQRPTAEQKHTLKECYRSCLELAAQHRMETLAFPAISDGIFGYPPDQAAEVAVQAVADFLATSALPKTVFMVAFQGTPTVEPLTAAVDRCNMLLEEGGATRAEEDKADALALAADVEDGEQEEEDEAESNSDEDFLDADEEIEDPEGIGQLIDEESDTMKAEHIVHPIACNDAEEFQLEQVMAQLALTPYEVYADGEDPMNPGRGLHERDFPGCTSATLPALMSEHPYCTRPNCLRHLRGESLPTVTMMLLLLLLVLLLLVLSLSFSLRW